MCALKKNDSRWPKRVDVQSRGAGGFDVGDGVGERERHFLHRRRAGFADVVAADRDRVPLRHLALAEREDVGDDAQRRFRRVDVGAARDVLLEDVVLNRARQARRARALAPGHGDVERQQDDGRRVDGHRRRDAIERDAVEQRRHVLDRVDRHADAADLAGGERVIGVVADLRRQIEGDAQAADALREQVAIAAVRLRGRPEARVLAHRPEPAAIHGRLDAAGVRELARHPEVAGRVEVGQVGRGQEGWLGVAAAHRPIVAVLRPAVSRARSRVRIHVGFDVGATR